MRFHYNDKTTWELRKGGKLLAKGTADAIAKEMGVTKTNIMRYQSANHMKTIKNSKRPQNIRILIPIDAQEREPKDSKWKWCAMCEDYYLKSLSNFNHDAASEDGLATYCRLCSQDYGNKRRRKKKKEGTIELDKQKKLNREVPVSQKSNE